MSIYYETPKMENDGDFVWIHFPKNEIVHADILEMIVKDLMESFQTDFSLLLDLSTIEGFSVDAFELILELIVSCRKQVAVLSENNAISLKYAKLIEMSVGSPNTRVFHSLKAARHWLVTSRNIH